MVRGLTKEGVAIGALLVSLNTRIASRFQDDLYAAVTLLLEDFVATRRIVRATKYGDTVVLLGWRADLLSRFHGLAPELTVNVFGIVRRYIQGSTA